MRRWCAVLKLRDFNGVWHEIVLLPFWTRKAAIENVAEGNRWLSALPYSADILVPVEIYWAWRRR